MSVLRKIIAFIQCKDTPGQTIVLIILCIYYSQGYNFNTIWASCKGKHTDYCFRLPYTGGTVSTLLWCSSRYHSYTRFRLFLNAGSCQNNSTFSYGNTVNDIVLVKYVRNITIVWLMVIPPLLHAVKFEKACSYHHDLVEPLLYSTKISTSSSIIIT